MRSSGEGALGSLEASKAEPTASGSLSQFPFDIGEGILRTTCSVFVLMPLMRNGEFHALYSLLG